METDGHLNYKCNRRTDSVNNRRTDRPDGDVRTDWYDFLIKHYLLMHIKERRGWGMGWPGYGGGDLPVQAKNKRRPKLFTVTPLRQRLNRQNWQTLERQTLTDFGTTDFNSTYFGTTDFHRLWNGDGFRDIHRKKFTHPIHFGRSRLIVILTYARFLVGTSFFQKKKF